MLSATFITILASAALTAAAPAVEDKRGAECAGTGAYYVCYNNGFRGACSVDPCAISWCPDYTANTCTKTTTTTPTWTPPPVEAEKPKTVECSGTGAYHVCANNGFRGSCSVDPCALAWCPDYAANTCTKKTTTWTPPVVVAEEPKTGTTDPSVCKVGYFQVCASGFRGCCAQDACSLGYCPGA
jgi:hypothetical protein